MALPVRTMLLVALALLAWGASAQEENDSLADAPGPRQLLQCRAGWWANDTLFFTVRTARRQTLDGRAVSDLDFGYDVRVTVLDSSSSGYRLTWQRQSHDPGRFRTTIAPVMRAMLDSIEDIRIYVLTDLNGTLLGVEDYDAVTGRWMDLQERLILWLAQDRNTAERTAMQERLERWRTNRPLMSQALLEDIGIFFFPYGAYVFQDSAYTQPYDLPNAMTGGHIPAQATVNLSQSDELTYRIDVQVVPEPGPFNEAVRANLNTLRKTNRAGRHVKRKGMPAMDTRMDYAFVIGSTKSWPHRFQSTVTIRADNFLAERSTLISIAAPKTHAHMTEIELDALVSEFPNDPEPYRQRGYIRSMHADFNGAVEDYTMAITLDSAYAYCWMLRAWALREGNQHAAALQDAQHALALDSSQAEYHQACGRILVDLHRYPEAEASLRKAITIDSTYQPALFSLGYMLKELYRFEEALAVYDRAVAAHPDKAAGYGHRASARFHLMTPQQDSLALVDLRHALSIDPDDDGSLTALGNHYLDTPLYDSAAFYFDRVITVDPNDATAMHNRGYARLQQGRLDEAIRDLRESLEMDSTMTFAYNNIGWALHLAGRSEEGLANIDKSIAHMPTNAFAFYNRGRVLNGMGRTAEACEAWQHAQDIGFQKAYGDAVAKELDARCGK